MKFKAFAKKHAPLALTLIAIGTGVAAAITAAKKKAKYDALVEETRKEKEEAKEELTKKDVVKCVFKAYWIPAILIAVAAGSALASNYISSKRITEEAIKGATMVAAGKKVHDEYVNVVESKLGPKKVEEINNEIAKRRAETILEAMPDRIAELDSVDEEGDGPVPGKQLIADCWSGAVWVDDPVKLEKRFNDFNADYITGNEFVSLEEYYDHMKIPVKGIQNIQYGGWDYQQKKIEFGWTVFPISNGPNKGKIVWAMQFRPGSEPLSISD